MSTQTKNNSYDAFLSHGTPDKPWVRLLYQALKVLELRVFFDEEEIAPGVNHVVRLSEALRQSRYLVLVLSENSESRPWMLQEWTSYLTEHGPSERVFLVKLGNAKVPTILKSIQWIEAAETEASAQEVAKRLSEEIPRIEHLPEGDTRRLTFGQELAFDLRSATDGDDRKIVITRPEGNESTILPSWFDRAIGANVWHFRRLIRRKELNDVERGELGRLAGVLGDAFRELLFGKEPKRLQEAIDNHSSVPRLTIRGGRDQEDLLGLPWELIRHDGRFLVQDGLLDVVRSIRHEDPNRPRPQLPEPKVPFKLVVHVAAPVGSGLDYEGESYRIVRALTGRSRIEMTDLGTLDDMVNAVDSARQLTKEEQKQAPGLTERTVGVHFSGHGAPGLLIFENDEGGEEYVKLKSLVETFKRESEQNAIPPFFYLASCFGQEAGQSKEKKPTPLESVAVGLHRAGACQVVGYAGPILDVKSTMAEEAFYQAVAEGKTTTFAARMARLALAQQPKEVGNLQTKEAGGDRRPVDPAPFAWSQLVLYQDGPDRPLSVRSESARNRLEQETPPKRIFLDLDRFGILDQGFIGRRVERHQLRKMIKDGKRTIVFQGLGGLGKSTLALKALRLLGPPESWLIFWADQAEKATQGEDPIATDLLNQLLKYCREHKDLDWDELTKAVDLKISDPTEQFLIHFRILLENVDRLIVYVDNLESLMIGPEEARDAEFASWKSESLRQIWKRLEESARGSGDKMHLVASCRYDHEDFGDGLLPVGAMPPSELFRMMGWFPSLRELSLPTRARLVAALDGHPRAVEFSDDLIKATLKRHQRRGKKWQPLIDPDTDELIHEWATLVNPVLPKVDEKLRDNLLFQALWDNVYDPPAHRMLYRATLLRRPWDWDLMLQLGDPDVSADEVDDLALRLCQSSLVERIDRSLSRDLQDSFTIHPATVRYITKRFGDDPALRQAAHLRIGNHLEAEAKQSRSTEVEIEAGHHLFEAAEYSRAWDLIEDAKIYLRNRGRVREGLRLVEPFLAPALADSIPAGVLARCRFQKGIALNLLGDALGSIDQWQQSLHYFRASNNRQFEGAVLGNLGVAYASLGRVEEAISSYEQHLTIAREISARLVEGASLGNLGLAYADLGRVAEAISYYEQDLTIAREIGDRRGEGAALGNLGLAYASLGRVEEAISSYEQHLTIAREISARLVEGASLGNLGLAYADLGRVAEAISYYEQDLTIAREIGDRRGEGAALGNLGLAYASLGRVEEAIKSLEQSLVICREIKDPRMVQIFEPQLAKLQGDG